MIALLLTLASAPPAYLHWNFGEPVVERNYHICHARSVSWVDEKDRVVWTRELPERMRKADSGLCDCVTPDGNECAAEIRYYREQPRRTLPPFVLGQHDLGETVAVADATGVLILDKKTGEPVLDWADTNPSEDMVFFDNGSFQLGECTGKVRSAQLFARCGDQLIYFNRRTAARIDAGRAEVLATGTKIEHGPEPVPRVTARVPVGDTVLKLEGIVFLR